MQSIYAIARVCHEANKAYCEINGDYSKEPWDVTEEWQQNSAMKGVVFVKDNPDADPSATHNNWLETKKTDGWTYGERDDEYKKEHPCCVPYDELPEGQQVKDKLFNAIIRALLTEK